MDNVQAIRRLWRQRNAWREAGECPEVSWTVRGIEIALKELRALIKEERLRAEERRPRPLIARWLAADLFRVVRRAHSELYHGQRILAMRVLAKAIEQVKAKQRLD